MTITLHYLNKSRATRVVWLLEELNLKHETKLYKRNPQTMLAPPELAKVHPSGASPLLEEDGVVYAESGWILEHLVETHGTNSPLIWRNAEEKNAIKYALYAAESNIMISGIMLAVHQVAVQRLPWGLSRFIKLIFSKIDSMYPRPQFEKCLRNLSNQIEANGGYYVGNRFTVADIMYRISLEQFENFPSFELNYERDWPVLHKWIQRLETETKYRQAKEREQVLETNSRL